MGLLSAASPAQEIYKCVVKGAITYQQSPCELPAPAKGVSSDTVLIGVWRYDHDGTMAWMKRHAQMKKEEEAMLNALAGHLTLTFTKNSVLVDRTAYEVTVDDNVKHIEAKQHTDPYTVMSASPQVVSMTMQAQDTFSDFTVDFHFDGRDVMWISVADQKLTGVDDANARIYYKRVH